MCGFQPSNSYARETSGGRCSGPFSGRRGPAAPTRLAPENLMHPHSISVGDPTIASRKGAIALDAINLVYGIICHMRAAPVSRLKHELDDGAIVEMAIWKMPQKVAGSHHGFKYRLYFRKGGKRLVGYDNERGKGDHRHVLGRELAYRFTSPDRLIADFLANVEEARRKR